MSLRIADKKYYRSVHIPLSITNERNPVVIPNRAKASFFSPQENLFQDVTVYSDYIIRTDVEFSAPTIALLLYGEETLWWAICLYNGIVFPTEELYAGRTIRIPDLEQLNYALTRYTSNNANTQSRFVQI